jgi:DNA-3-methyladenine glycosylase I
VTTDLPRCGWATSAPEYVAYHDDEWGRPLHGERALFERLSLEAFQSGLSWLIILRKRPAFRAAFAGFDVDAVAGFDTGGIESLLRDPGIVRNRAKIEATVANARAVRASVDDLDALLWSFAPARHRRPRALGEIASVSPESTAMAKELRRRGFRFVGPTTAYALMQATGMVDDHVVGCWRASAPATRTRDAPPAEEEVVAATRRRPRHVPPPPPT